MTNVAGRNAQQGLVKAVAEDLKHVTSMRGKVDEQFYRRSLIRTMFSLIDAFCYHLKQESLSVAKHNPITFSKRTLEVLTETRINKSIEGSQTTRPYYPSPQENLRVAIRTYAKVKSGFVPDHIRHHPIVFAISKKIRDRITHPKAADDLVVSNEEFREAILLLQWLQAVFDWQTEQELAWIDLLKQQSHAMFEESIRRIRESVMSQTNKDAKE